MFRTAETLGQKAGVTRHDIPALVAKELVDNALDAGGDCRLRHEPGKDHLIVRDDGPGIPGDDAAIARLFSINRPLVSTKLLRLPTRGALGNGLRVVAGAVLASEGELVVSTRGRSLRLVPQFETGHTVAERLGDWDEAGTEVRVRLGKPWDRSGLPNSQVWTDLTLAAARHGQSSYKGRSSPHWYDSDAFLELLHAWTGTVRELIACLDGCAEPKAGKIAAEFKGRAAAELGRHDADRLLATARKAARPVKASRLGSVGRDVDGFPSAGYARCEWTWRAAPARGPHAAAWPVVIEAWAEALDPDDIDCLIGSPPVDVLVNRTQVPMRAEAVYDKSGHSQFLSASDWERRIPRVGLRPVRVVVNISTPYMPLANDGKTPALADLGDPLEATVTKAMYQAKRGGGNRGGAATTQKAAVRERLDAAIARASGDGKDPFRQRQVFYCIRDAVATATGETLQWQNFVRIIDEYEAENGPIEGMLRDSRGVLYHPHTAESIPVGTEQVADYQRPALTFNKIIFVEKEGYQALLRQSGWAERNDCAVVTTKGQPTRAVRDLLDKLGAGDEPLDFFSIHDADGPGTIIHQSLVNETIARPGRTVVVTDLGLDPEEGLAMGLPIEQYTQRGPIACADNVPDAWREWFGVGETSGQRIELNAMTSPQFFDWLDAKMADHVGKVIPPAAVQAGRLRDQVRAQRRADIAEQILTKADLEGQVDEAMRALDDAIAATESSLIESVTARLNVKPELLWSAAVDAIARGIARAGP